MKIHMLEDGKFGILMISNLIDYCNFLTKLYFFKTFFLILENLPLTDSVNLVEKSNMLLLLKELNKKDRNLPAQLLIATEKRRNMPIEKVWKENGF